MAFCWAVAAVLLACLASPTLAVAQVSSADQICAPAADPCIISQTVTVADEAVLDFGLRTVVVASGGTLDTGAGTVTVRCGSFQSTVGASNVAVKARGANGEGSTDGGHFIVETRRACSDDANLFCLSDAECTVGPCGIDGQCAQDGSGCAEDSDCRRGSCTLGDGTVDVLGRVRADGRRAGHVVLRAAGDIDVRGLMDVDSSGASFDGGTIEIDSADGTLTIDAPIQAKGGGMGQGGTVTFSAGNDIVINDLINAEGGSFDGGCIEIESSNDVGVNAPLRASATNGDGAGGDIVILAARDLAVAQQIEIEAHGSQAREDLSGGDGGSIELGAGRDLSLAAGAGVSADGAERDGSGETVILSAGRDLVLSGLVSSSARGSDGGGGSIAAAVGRSAEVAPLGRLEANGGALGSGSIEVLATTDLDHRGTIVIQATSGGASDLVRLGAGGTVRIDGAISIAGQGSGPGDGTLDVAGCTVELTSSGSVVNTEPTGVNTIVGRASIAIRAGAELIASQPSGANRLVRRSDSPPPLVLGTVTPAAQQVIDDGLEACAVCGNSTIEPGESCDDGNQMPGDDCSEDCQLEVCIEDTPGYPDVPLCDDGLVCTTDQCDTEIGFCRRTFNCDDGIECTEEVCGLEGECVRVEHDSLCENSNPCTVDVCVTGVGCLAFATDDPCDDGVDCTADDQCVQGQCRGQGVCPNGTGCNFATGQCDPGITTTTTTTVSTLPGPVCGDDVVEVPEQCDDGDSSWQIGESCTSLCTRVACADPDDSGQVTAADALFTLRAAIGLNFCDPCVCDVDDGGGGVKSTDALTILRLAIGIDVPIGCSPCP